MARLFVTSTGRQTWEDGGHYQKVPDR